MRSLAWWIRRSPLEPRDAVGWVLRIARGIASLHEMGVAHGRISANAFFIEETSCRAPGLMLDVDHAERLVTFMSPRRARERGACPDDDVWALGVLLYQAITGALPFPGDDRWAVLERIGWRPASPIEVYDVTESGLQRLVDRLLSLDNKARLRSVEDLERAVLHRYPSMRGLPALCFGEPPGFDAGAKAGPASGRAEAQVAVTAGAAGQGEPSQRATPSGGDGGEGDDGAAGADGSATRVASQPVAAAVEPVAAAVEPAPTGREAGHDRPLSARGRPPVSGAAARTSARRARAPTAVWLWVGGPVLAALLLFAVWWVERGRAPPPPAGPAHGIAVAGPTRGAPARTSSQLGAGADRGQPPSTGSPRMAAEWATAETATAAATRAPVAGSASARATDEGAEGGDLPACVSGIFPPATFAATAPRFAFLCSEADPRRGADALQTEIVLGKGGRSVTPAMHEWARLGWYQMALFAVVRAACCTTAPPLESALGAEPCRLDGTLTGLGQSVVYGSETEYNDALAGYGKAVRCVVAAHGARAYGESAAPAGPERIAFDRAVRRVRAALRPGHGPSGTPR